jgi:hypothetical protein
MAHRAVPYGARAGVRAPAADDTTTHIIYVKVATGADDDTKSRAITLELLQYIHTQMPMFAQMGITVKVSKVRSQDLQDPRLIEAMRRRGIPRLPALVTPNNVFIGLKEITDVYERNIKEFNAVLRRGELPGGGAGTVDEDDLASYYRDEMAFDGAEDEESDEKGIGEGGDMMNSYRQMMERRENSEGGRRPRPGGRPPATTSVAREGRAERGAGRAERGAGHTMRSQPDDDDGDRSDGGGGRPDNISGDHDDDNDEIQETIDRLSRDIDDGMRSRAFTSGGGNSLDDDGDDPQDDLMESAYWSGRVAATDM